MDDRSNLEEQFKIVKGKVRRDLTSLINLKNICNLRNVYYAVIVQFSYFQSPNSIRIRSPPGILVGSFC